MVSKVSELLLPRLGVAYLVLFIVRNNGGGLATEWAMAGGLYLRYNGPLAKLTGNLKKRT